MFAANVSLKERLQTAVREWGFSNIEIAFPYTWSIAEWRSALQNYPANVVLINTPKGCNGELGLAAVEERESDFKAGIETAISYCEALKCPNLHVMSGTTDLKTSDETFTSNITSCAAVLKSKNITVFLEAISPGTIRNYYLSSFDRTTKLILAINLDNVKLQFDTFHLANLGYSTTDIVRVFNHHRNVIDYVQVAQAPVRNEVIADGSVDCRQVFSCFVDKGYRGYIGLEFIPSQRNIINPLLNFLSEF